MSHGAGDFGIRFSTDSVPERERLPFFRESLGRSIMRLDLGPYDDSRPLRYAAAVHEFDGVCVMSAQTNGHICRRTQPLLTDGHDEFILSTNLSGFSLPSQAGREFRMDAGPAVLLSGSDVGARDCPVPGRVSDIAHSAPAARRDGGQTGRRARAPDTSKHGGAAPPRRLYSAGSEKAWAGTAGIAPALCGSYQRPRRACGRSDAGRRRHRAQSRHACRSPARRKGLYRTTQRAARAIGQQCGGASGHHATLRAYAIRGRGGFAHHIHHQRAARSCTSDVDRPTDG